MPGIRIKENESFENALRRFKKQVEKTGILSEIRKRETLREAEHKTKEESAGRQEKGNEKNEKNYGEGIRDELGRETGRGNETSHEIQR